MIRNLLFIIYLIVFISISGFTQRKNSYGQNIEMFKADRVILTFNYLKWEQLPAEIDLYGLNRGFYLGYFLDNPIGGSRLSFAFGGSITSNNLYSDALPSYLVEAQCVSNGFIKIKDICSSTTYFKTNKMTFNYIGIPIELRLRLGKNEYWKLSAGFDIGYLMSNYIKYEGNNVFLKTSESIKIKQFNIKDVNHIRYGASLRMSYNRFGLRIYYPLSTTFKNTISTFFPIEIGLSLMVF